MLTVLTRPISLLLLQHPSISLSVCVCVCVLVSLQRKRNEQTKGKGSAKEGITRRFLFSGSFLKFKVETLRVCLDMTYFAETENLLLKSL